MKPKHVISPRINERGRLERDSLVTPHKLEGGKRKGRTMKVKRIRRKRAYVTVKQAKAALAVDPAAQYDPVTKCLIYNRKADT